jgi:hypothetical protein
MRPWNRDDRTEYANSPAAASATFFFDFYFSLVLSEP